MEPNNIMSTLAPKPPFSPAKKNEAVKFKIKAVNAIKATIIKLKK